jgi:DHA2 family multidrug resistance protein-like MFS transporter
MTNQGIPKAGRREWIALAVIALPCLLYSMDLTVLYLAVPSITADLHPSGAQLLWITDVYGFLLAGSLITMGVLGDRIGRRRLLLIGAGAFGAVSVVAAFSTTPEMLIASRALLGVAAATLAPSTLSLIRNMFLDPRQRTVAIAVWATSFSVGAALGPLLGGILLELFWWGSVFLLAVPAMALLLVLGPLFLPEFRETDAGRIDLRSAGLSVSAVLSAIYGLKQLAVGGSGPAAAAAIAAGFALGVVFVRRQQRLAAPLIDLGLFRIRAFSASVATNGLSLALTFGVFLLFAQYLQLVVGLSPLQAGLWTLPSSGGFIVGSLVTPAIVRRVKPSSVTVAGMLLAAAGLALLTQAGADSGVGLVVTGSVLIALGVAPVVTLSTDLIVGAVPAERAGEASGISETAAELGGALGIAVLGSVGGAVYRAALGGELPQGTAGSARQSLEGAVAASDSLSGPAAAQLLAAAHDAFAQGLQTAAAVGVVVAVAAAVLAARLLAPTAGERASRTLEPECTSAA